MSYWFDSIIELMEFVGMFILYLVGIVTFPLWIIPYLIYKRSRT